MRTRDYVIEYNKALDDSGTLIKDLDLVDPVSALLLEFYATNGTTSNPDNFISDVITKIEIVDGSEVLYAVSLTQLECFHFYKLKQTPVLFPSDWPGGQQRHGCLLLFGRHLWDTEFGMDFTKFKNPQLKITSNLGAIRAAADDGAFVSESLRANIVAKIMEDVTPPTKYLRAKELVTWAGGSGGDIRKELPLLDPYRLMIVRLWVEGSSIDELITYLKLTCDGDKFIITNQHIKKLDEAALMEYGLIQYKHDFKKSSAADALRVIPNKEPYGTLVSRDPGSPLDFVQYGQWSSIIDYEQYAGAGAIDTVARRVTGFIHGHAIHASLPIAFGNLADPATWFDPTPYRKIEAVLTEQSTSCVMEIALEQAATLPV